MANFIVYMIDTCSLYWLQKNVYNRLNEPPSQIFTNPSAVEICIFVIIYHKWNQSFFSENTPKIPQQIFAHHGSNFKTHRISQNCDFDGFKKEAQLSPRDPLDAVALSVEVLSTNNGGGYHIAWSHVSLRNYFCGSFCSATGIVTCGTRMVSLQ